MVSVRDRLATTTEISSRHIDQDFKRTPYPPSHDDHHSEGDNDVKVEDAQGVVRGYLSKRAISHGFSP